MAHKYLDKIKIDDDICVPNTCQTDSSKKRQRRFEAQREKYGFDERETWSMDFTLACWLYERLKWYKRHAPVDMTFHKFDVPVIKRDKDGELRKKAKRLNQGEVMDLMLDYLKDYIESGKHMSLKKEEEATTRYLCALEMLAKIAPALWW